jgi:hypothetical protein
MHGFITTRDVLSHPRMIIGYFGLRCYLRCLSCVFLSSRKTTFLECIAQA